jgi:hypothetical protein
VKLYTAMQVHGNCANLQLEMNVLSLWFDTSHLRISHTSIPSSRSISSQLCRNNFTLAVANEPKDLGVLIDDVLNFFTRIYYILFKAIARACLIHTCFSS